MDLVLTECCDERTSGEGKKESEDADSLIAHALEVK